MTDKARAIFTWLHHNISYDVYSFFNNCVKRKTPQETLTSGLAVCEGYASLFTALATKAGLESVVVSGHGKGYSFTTLKAGDPLPPFKCGHAWNAVKIDDGEWKLIDSCWGAGNICDRNGPKLYNKQFSPEMFTYDNETFGLRHFPENPAYFFRNDGRATIPWEEYVTGGTLDPQEPVLVYSNIAPEEGFKSSKFLPKNLNISTNPAAHSSPTVRFQFERICPHWDPIKDGPGKPFQYFLACGIGADGHYKDAIPFDNNGKFWWCDAPVNRLGKAGDKVMVYCVKTIENRDGRGLTAQEYLKKKGKVAMSFGCAACWELV